MTARQDYWESAAACMKTHPVLGSGPGTFMAVYRETKRPEAEMTRLVHNDYLQQGSDGGILAGLVYLAWIVSVLWLGRPNLSKEPIVYGVWLGCLGIALQSLSEFGLYIPAIAWPWFLGLGTLCGRLAAGNSVDKANRST